MPIDWSGVPMNCHDAPLGVIRVFPIAHPGKPLYLDAVAIIAAQEDDMGTAITTPGGRVLVREKINEVFRLKAEANTVGTSTDAPKDSANANQGSRVVQSPPQRTRRDR